MSTTEKETPFELKTENNIQFSSKCKDIFGNLEKLEKKHEENTKFRTEDDVDIQKSDYLDVDTETITSAFKTPQLGRGSNREGGGPWRHRAQHRDRGPPPWSEHCDRGEDRSADRGSSSIQRELQPKQFGGRRGGHPYYNSRGSRRQRTPDYKMNPKKWTKYSLEDVDNEDMTESSNTKAAFAFLEERRKLREGEMKVEAVNTDNTSCSKGIFTFKKPVKNENKKGKSSVSSKISNQLLNSKEDDISAGVGEEEDNKMEEMTEKVQEEKVTFKSLKKSKRSIRSRDTDDDD